MRTNPTPPSPNPPSPWLMLAISAVFIGVGALILSIGLGLLPVDRDHMHAPGWVVAVMGLAFLAGGLLLIMMPLSSAFPKATNLRAWLEYAATLTFLVSFAAITTWLGLDSGERAFSISVLGGLISGYSSVWLGRCLFGGFGLMLWFASAWYAVAQPLHLLGRWPRSEQQPPDGPPRG